MGALKDRIEAMSRTSTINYLVLGPGCCDRTTWQSDMAMATSPGKWALPLPWSSPGAVTAGCRSLSAWPSVPSSGAGGPGTEVIYTNYLGSGLALDVFGFLFFSLVLCHPAVGQRPYPGNVGADLGVTLWSWLAATGALGLVVVAAINANGAIRLDPGRLIISRLLGSRTLDLGEIAAAAPLLVGGIESGLVLELRDHSRSSCPGITWSTTSCCWGPWACRDRGASRPPAGLGPRTGRSDHCH